MDAFRSCSASTARTTCFSATKWRSGAGGWMSISWSRSTTRTEAGAAMSAACRRLGSSSARISIPKETLAMVCGPEAKMRYMASVASRCWRAGGPHLFLDGAQHEMRHGAVRALPVRPRLRLQGWSGDAVRPYLRASSPSGRSDMAQRNRPRLAVWKFASCDGCQLSLLDLRGRTSDAGRRKSRSRISPRRRALISEGPYDLSLVEGSITTAHDAERIQQVRRAIEVSRHHRRLRHRRAAFRRCEISPT